MTSRRENGIIEALYDAGLGHQSWEECSRQLMDYLGGMTFMLATHGSDHSPPDVISTLGLSSKIVEEYHHFSQHDIWALGALERRLADRAMTGSQIVDDHELLQSYIYNEYLRPRVNARYVAGAVLPLADGLNAVIGIHRPHGDKDFNSRELARLNRLLPHVRRALEIRQKLKVAGREVDSAHLVLDRLTIGVILMSARGRLLHVNAAAEEILRSGDGLLRTPDGLRAINKEDDRLFQHLILRLRQGSGDARPAGGHLRIQRPSGRHAYAVMLAPAGPGVTFRDKAAPAVMVFVSDPGAGITADQAVLADLFGLTPAEGRLVLALLSGTSLPEFARLTGVSHNTVRTQLARAMARTDTRSQLELVLLVASSIGGTISSTAQPPATPGLQTPGL